MPPLVFVALAVGAVFLLARSSAASPASPLEPKPGNKPGDKPGDKAEPPIVDMYGKTTTGSPTRPPKAGLQTHPDFTWKQTYDAAAVDLKGKPLAKTPLEIATKVFGPEMAKARYVEMFIANPDRAPANPLSTDWKAPLKTGDVYLFPKTWNAWIDQTGRFAGKPELFAPDPAW